MAGFTVGAGQEAKHQHSHNAADAMNTKNVQRIVVGKMRLQFRHGKIANHSGGESDAKCRGNGDKSGRRRDGRQTGDHAGSRAQHAGSAFVPPFRNAQLKAAAAAEKCVAANALVASVPAFRALPALKPNQPTQSKPVPMSERTDVMRHHRLMRITRRAFPTRSHTPAPKRRS